MPANSKYLDPRVGHRIAKISAAILGGLLVTLAFHLALAAWFDKTTVIITSTYSAFILWVVLMMVAFMARSGLKIWGIYLALTLIFGGLTYLGL
ncbi:hypothetical protein [Pseudozobellia thermophila]|uniref:Uncharacterized protein n=1 Tax=Pseudozobellia thermophila TaxID=192903 RepID=A0A1M6HE08_9FLAO|nr:hypothetical protein [Pseudozobellia thermophila]SHJ20379.1 hypothetical protein SAMN04488513_10315 [Pseudozobellia thermophila]